MSSLKHTVKLYYHQRPLISQFCHDYHKMPSLQVHHQHHTFNRIAGSCCMAMKLNKPRNRNSTTFVLITSITSQFQHCRIRNMAMLYKKVFLAMNVTEKQNCLASIIVELFNHKYWSLLMSLFTNCYTYLIT